MEIKRFVGGMLESNGYIISCSGVVHSGSECLIIDPGYNPKKFIHYVTEENFTVNGIILTHHHYDHTGGVERIKKELGCPVLMHTLDADIYGKDVDVLLEDGDVLELTGKSSEGEILTDKLVVFNTPGHTHGSICLLSTRSKVCFTGDTVFNADLGRTDLEDGSEAEMRSSIHDVVGKWSNDITIYPGHGDPATMKQVRKINREFTDIINGE